MKAYMHTLAELVAMALFIGCGFVWLAIYATGGRVMADAIKTTKQTLIEARERISDQAAWGKGRRGLDRKFDTCCAAEAIEEAAPGFGQYEARCTAFNALRRAAKCKHITGWNDAPGRTHAEVLAAFDKAIEDTP